MLESCSPCGIDFARETAFVRVVWFRLLVKSRDFLTDCCKTTMTMGLGWQKSFEAELHL